MKCTIKKQDGSLTIAIPKDFADTLTLEEGCEVDVFCGNGKLTIHKALTDDYPEGCADAVEKYKSLNAGGMFDPVYGRLMFDRSDGKVWVDKFCSIGHNDFNVYHSHSIVNLGSIIESEGLSVTSKTVKIYAEKVLKGEIE